MRLRPLSATAEVYIAALHKTPGNRPTVTVNANGTVGKRERQKEKVARAASVSEGPVLESRPRDRLSDSGVRGSNQ
jgi:hypothetical protein